MRILRFFLIALVFASSCKDDEPSKPFERGEKDLVILNEGNFGWGEGTVSVYNTSTQEVSHDVYKEKNAQAIGNVLQSHTEINKLHYFVVNNSNKIVVTDSLFGIVQEISGLTSPRYLYQVSSEKAYVTDLYANAISIIDLKDNLVTGTIPFNGWSEKGVMVNNMLWVSAPETKYIYAVDIEQDAVVDSIECGFATESIVLDQANHIWVLSKGNDDNESGMLTEIDGSTMQVLERKPVSGLPTNLVYDEQNNQLYYINQGIWKLEAHTKEIPVEWLASDGNNFYNLIVDQENGEVYVSDIHDFVQRSTIYRLKMDGSVLDEFKAGIIAGNFFFTQK